MSNSAVQDLLATLPDPHGAKIEYNVATIVLHKFVREGMKSFTEPENVVGLFFGEDDPIKQALRLTNGLVFDTFKTEEQVRNWNGYDYELSNNNPLAVILKLSGDQPNWSS